MSVNNETKQSFLQRVVALFCVIVLFVSIGILMLFTPNIYASSAKSTQATSTSVVPADTGTPIDTPSPTDTPIPLTDTPVPPTNTPTPLPTNTPAPPPTNTPIPQPTHTPVPVPKNTPPPQPTTAGGPPITPPMATSTVAAGAPLATPPAAPSQSRTPDPATPSPQTTSATGGSILPPPVTDTTGSPTANPSDNQTTQHTATASRSMSTMLIVGALGLVAAALLAGLMWRRRQANKAQQKGQVQQVTPHYAMPWGNSIATNYAQFVQNASSIVESVAPHQDAASEETTRIPNTPIAPPNTPNNAIDPLLEAMMRQAQMGLFAVPGKEEPS